jgi:hypothetical protein
MNGQSMSHWGIIIWPDEVGQRVNCLFNQDGTLSKFDDLLPMTARVLPSIFPYDWHYAARAARIETTDLIAIPLVDGDCGHSRGAAPISDELEKWFKQRQEPA